MQIRDANEARIGDTYEGFVSAAIAEAISVIDGAPTEIDTSKDAEPAEARFPSEIFGQKRVASGKVMERYGVEPPEGVCEKIRSGYHTLYYRIPGTTQKVSLGVKPKHTVIAARPQCCECGMSVSHVAVERWRPNMGRKARISSKFDVAEEDALIELHFYGTQDGDEIEFTVDHIVPWSKGGVDAPWNLQTMCCACNRRKGNRWDGTYRTNPDFSAPCDREQKRRRGMLQQRRRLVPMSVIERNRGMSGSEPR